MKPKIYAQSGFYDTVIAVPNSYVTDVFEYNLHTCAFAIELQRRDCMVVPKFRRNTVVDICENKRQPKFTIQACMLGIVCIIDE